MPITFFNPNQVATYSSYPSSFSRPQPSPGLSSQASQSTQDSQRSINDPEDTPPYSINSQESKHASTNQSCAAHSATHNCSFAALSSQALPSSPSLSDPLPSFPPPASTNNFPLVQSTVLASPDDNDGAFLLALQRRHEQRFDQKLELAPASQDTPSSALHAYTLSSQIEPFSQTQQSGRTSRFIRASKSKVAYEELDSLLAADESHMQLESVEERFGDRKAKAISHLESIHLSFIDQLNTSVRIANARAAGAKTKKAAEAEGKVFGVKFEIINRSTGDMRVTSYPDEPGTNLQQSALTRWGIILRISSLLYEAILSDTPTTKRDIYYKDKALFRTQSVVDSYVDDIIATAGLKRADFNLRATEKGLVASNALEICFTSGAPLSLSATHATLIPSIERIEVLDAPNGLDWVLIVEKDAVFTPLCGSGLFTDPLLGAGVLITGKGYPDLATLQLTRAIADTFPNARIFGLVDADPHGLDILSVYTNGSRATKYSYDHDGLALGDRIEWLGVKVSELGRYDEMLPLSPRDVGKAMKMLQNVDLPVEWRRELCRMLMVNRKAEIEIVSTASNGSSGSYETTGLREGNRLVNYLVARMTA